MKIVDIRSKSDKELMDMVADNRKKLEQGWVDVKTKKISNVKHIKTIKVIIAQVLTEQRERELKKLEESNG